ncbi:hypothetical protein MHSWG343_05150 [Candidatus Mycoplasma haematohominis]|uniref:Uncharacterized protein n=1 Tax=Candidatus Mycoplasma haematohominis TaxID=1494318 RepID=A0A478FPU1_9MOLU|nr:hypothetical protein MHSWG343_05150 [Candidatus Mycoplasma haemohominis]
MSVAKFAVAGGLTAIVVGGGTGTFFLYVPAMPNYETIKTPIENKFGQDFQKHFVDATENNNSDWWNWSFKYKYYWNPAQSMEFKGLKSGNDLRSKCSAAYAKATKTEISKDGDSEQEKYETDVWIYCSIEGFKPITIDKSNSFGDDIYKTGTNSTKLGGTKKSKLISLNDERNNKFWEIQEAAFFKGSDDAAGLGAKATEASSVFKTLYDKTNRESTDTLKSKCKEKYDGDSNTTSDKETLRFCSLQGKQD